MTACKKIVAREADIRQEYILHHEYLTNTNLHSMQCGSSRQPRSFGNPLQFLNERLVYPLPQFASSLFYP